MRRGVKVAVIAVVVIIAILAGVYFYIFGMPSFEPIAKLSIKEGSVEVNVGSGWSAAADGMALGANHAIRTLANSQANIIFFDSSIVRLDQNTEVKLSQISSGNLSLEQLSGRTWNRVVGLSGISDYSVETPTTVITIRGTAFAVKVEADGETNVAVADGSVNISAVEIKEKIVEGKKIKEKVVKARAALSANQTLRISPQMLEQLEVKALEIRDEWMRLNEEKDEQFIMELKEKLKRRYANLIEIAKSQYNVTDEDIERAIIKYIRTGERPF